MKQKVIAALAALGLSGVIGFGVQAALANEHDGGKSAPAKHSQSATSSSYPLDTCPVTGEKLGAMGKPIVYNYKGREVRFCCKSCVAKFEADPKKYLDKMDKAIIDKQLPAYPLKTCVVTGDKLDGGSMGKPINYVYKNRLVRFCCKDCIKEFNADPAKYLKKLDAAKHS